MNQDKDYLFKSQRLGFRNWESADIDELHKINSDKKVMEFFPRVSTRKQTIEFIEKMKSQFSEKGFCYYAVDKLDDKNFIGFIGLSEQTFIADFTPCVDIGWRIKYSEWNKGFATEGAIKCLQYAFEVLKIEEIFSIAPKINLKSTHIMAKIGLKSKMNLNIPY
ncbi:MAG: GNAT family N-acetyltransferase [Bacteroidetes bacterium]|nr:GNAT family N-acetyltransferase [Bacteroidota bacterium]